MRSGVGVAAGVDARHPDAAVGRHAGQAWIASHADRVPYRPCAQAMIRATACNCLRRFRLHSRLRKVAMPICSIPIEPVLRLVTSHWIYIR